MMTMVLSVAGLVLAMLFDDVTFVLDAFDDDDDGIIANCGNAD
jgi:hypothetical protein